MSDARFDKVIFDLINIEKLVSTVCLELPMVHLLITYFSFLCSVVNLPLI